MIQNLFSDLIIANTTELFLKETFLLTDKALSEMLDEDNYCSNRAIFYEGDDKIVILPFPIDSTLFEPYRQQLGYKNVICWFPKDYTSDSLCESILNDGLLVQKIIDLIAQNPNIVVTSYAYTPQFAAFMGVLRQKGRSFRCDTVPTKDSIVRRLNAKAEFRRIVEAIERQTSSVLIPKGKIMGSLEGILTEMRQAVLEKRSFVVKANYGNSGCGVFIAPTIPTEKTIDSFLELVACNQLWTSSEMVIEEKIISKVVHSPSAELKITADTIEITYLCNQVLSEKGEFLGILLGKSIIAPVVEAQMRHTAGLIAQTYQQLGYRGFFDVDYVLDDHQQAFAVETNVRRTGGTHIYDLLRHLYGADWIEKIYAVSNDSWEMNQRFPKSADALASLQPMLYDGTEGLIITNFSRHRDLMGFVIFAKTMESLQQRLTAFKKIFSDF